jgi:putative ABC transport system ATP-binding protein
VALIEIQEVSKLFGFGDAATLALDEISLSVEKGEFVAIMGPSGCGKSTLMNIIGMLDKPTYGGYLLDNRHAARFGANRQARLRRDRIGFVFQSFNLIPRLNVLENVALPLAYRGMTSVRRLKQASDMLEVVGLREREYFYPRQLSQGQIQRVAIARALINKPSIIIADEPTGNLDSVDSRVVMELFSDIHRQGNTVLLVTHNPELTRFANRVIYMQDGRIIGDEQTAIGDVARGASYTHYRKHKKTDVDIVAGVSALMHEIPAKELDEKPKSEVKGKKRTKRGRSRKAKR